VINVKTIILIALKSICVSLLVQFSIGILLACAWAKPEYRFADQLQTLVYILILALVKAYPIILALYVVVGFAFQFLLDKIPASWLYLVIWAIYLFAFIFIFIGYHGLAFSRDGLGYLCYKILRREKSDIFLGTASCFGYFYLLTRIRQSFRTHE